jgi:hypothetical protein
VDSHECSKFTGKRFNSGKLTELSRVGSGLPRRPAAVEEGRPIFFLLLGEAED